MFRKYLLVAAVMFVLGAVANQMAPSLHARAGLSSFMKIFMADDVVLKKGGDTNLIIHADDDGATSDAALKFKTDNTSPTVRFTLGVDSGDSNNFKLEAADGLGGGTPAMTVQSDGKIALGATSASAVLDVYKTAEDSAWAMKASGNGWLAINPNTSLNAWNAMAEAGDKSIIFTNGTIESGALTIGPWSAGNNGIRIQADGNVGIGSNAPGADLDVTGTILADMYDGPIRVKDTRNTNSAPTAYTKEISLDFKKLTVLDSAPGTGTYGGLLTLAPWGDDSGDAHHQMFWNEGGIFWRQGQPQSATWDSWYEVMTTASDGSGSGYDADTLDAVDSGSFLRSDASDSFSGGIGITMTIASTSNLDVDGNLLIADPSVTFDGANTDFVMTGDLSVNTNHLVVDKSSGYIGIGETTPDDFLEISGSLGGNGLHLDSSSGAGVLIDRAGTGNHYRLLFETAGVEKWAIGNKGHGNEVLGFYYNGSSTASAVLNESGNLGIGVTAPTRPLHVVRAFSENASTYGIFADTENSGTASGSNKYHYGGYFDSDHKYTESGVNASTYGTIGYGHVGGAYTYSLVAGNYGLALSSSTATSGQDNLRASTNYAYKNVEGGLVTNMVASYNLAEISNINDADADIEVTNAYGAYNWIRLQGGDISVAYGTRSEVQTHDNADAGEDISTAYGVFSRVLNLDDDNATGLSDITTGYAYYGRVGAAAGSTDIPTAYGMYLTFDDVTTSTGLYVTGEDKNYLSGALGIGATDPGVAKAYVYNNSTNVGMYIGDGTPFGQAKLEIDGGAASHIWVAESGTRVFSITSGGAGYFEGAIDMNSNKITELATPTAATDAATKAYVDSVAAGGSGGQIKVGSYSSNVSTWTTVLNISGSGALIGFSSELLRVSGTLYYPLQVRVTIDGGTVSDTIRLDYYRVAQNYYTDSSNYEYACYLPVNLRYNSSLKIEMLRTSSYSPRTTRYIYTIE